MTMQPHDDLRLVRRCAMDLWYACVKALWQARRRSAPLDTIVRIEHMTRDAADVVQRLRDERTQRQAA